MAVNQKAELPMTNIESKVDFLKNQYIPLLRQLDMNAERRWGKMTVHQMIEHMADSIRIANGRDPHQLVTANEHVARMQAFLMSDKPFKENTPNSLLNDIPPSPRHNSPSDSLDKLEEEINIFFEKFKGDPSLTVMNPFFGALSFSMWVQLLYKHAWHHLRQFGVEQVPV
jgi:hypothetical protein